VKLEKIVIYLSALILFISALFTSLESPVRYIKYLLFVVLITLLFLQKKMVVNTLLYKNLRLYFFLIVVNFLIALLLGNLTIRFVEESMLIFLPIFSAVLLLGFRKLNLNECITTFFYSYVAAFCIFYFADLVNVPKLLSSFINALRYSTFPTESWMAFPFGIFSIYYIVEKKNKLALFALVFFLLSFKRISMVGFIVSIGVYLLSYRYLNYNFNRKKITSYFLSLNLFFLGVLYLFINGFFTRIIYKQTGISINWFTQGRFQIYNDVINHFSDKTWLGSSLGSTHLFILQKYKDIAFLHSDILKIIIEFGFISFTIWLGYFMYINLGTKKSVPIILYINILFLSDNVFIYFDTLFILYLVLVKFKNDDSIKTID
jgi:hypothetical protein